MKLVFIIINKSPITLNWVINLAGKSNPSVRVIPFPEGALRRKEAARSLLPEAGCAHWDGWFSAAHLFRSQAARGSASGERMYLRAVPVDRARVWAFACIVNLAEAYLEKENHVFSMCRDCSGEKKDASSFLLNDPLGAQGLVRKACLRAHGCNSVWVAQMEEYRHKVVALVFGACREGWRWLKWERRQWWEGF